MSDLSTLIIVWQVFNLLVIMFMSSHAPGRNWQIVHVLSATCLIGSGGALVMGLIIGG